MNNRKPSRNNGYKRCTRAERIQDQSACYSVKNSLRLVQPDERFWSEMTIEEKQLMEHVLSLFENKSQKLDHFAEEECSCKLMDIPSKLAS